MRGQIRIFLKMRNYEHSGLFSSTLDFPFFSVTFLFTDLYTIIKGNIKFSARDNRGALKLYTESVICAPDIGPELGLAFANRSAALFHLGQYKAACDDISMALQHKYPKHLGWLALSQINCENSSRIYFVTMFVHCVH